MRAREIKTHMEELGKRRGFRVLALDCRAMTGTIECCNEEIRVGLYRGIDGAGIDSAIDSAIRDTFCWLLRHPRTGLYFDGVSFSQPSARTGDGILVAKGFHCTYKEIAALANAVKELLGFRPQF